MNPDRKENNGCYTVLAGMLLIIPIMLLIAIVLGLGRLIAWLILG